MLHLIRRSLIHKSFTAKVCEVAAILPEKSVHHARTERSDYAKFGHCACGRWPLPHRSSLSPERCRQDCRASDDPGYIASAGLPAPLLVYLIAIIVEVGGGLSLLVGFQTRIVALILAAFTLAAALAFHNKFADPSEMIHFFKDLAIIGGLLQLAAFGQGSVSLDARRLNFAH